jgi:hypothetical protein
MHRMTEATATMARTLAMLSHVRHDRKRQRALLRHRVLRVLVTDLVAARTAAGMTQQEVAMRMWTTKSAVSTAAYRGSTGRALAWPDAPSGASSTSSYPVNMAFTCALAVRPSVVR